MLHDGLYTVGQVWVGHADGAILVYEPVSQMMVRQFGGSSGVTQMVNLLDVDTAVLQASAMAF